MKKIIPILLSILMVLSLAACAGNSNNPSESSSQNSTASTNENKTESSNTSASGATDSQPDDAETGKKVLVAYFSATGTTKKLAEYAADAMDAELYEIVPQQPYTSADLDYGDKNSRSTKEMNDPGTRPEINGSVENMADYDIVFIGYPIWWGEAPRIVSTFMESYDFSGKTVVTFSTSGSSGHNDSSIQPLATGVNWITGTRFASNSSRDDMVEWINGLGLDIQEK
ncbi:MULTISPECIES: flavodoxin [unclassified Ruminococcus]|uniref:flavodoxin n=1 Tax=unclassified Ruminococcus TaxID=2608920 RepID=UPI00210C681C|nr:MULTISPECIES: flavodoxin [unclassified Ruminococcus]MCQ4022495.1 flavodoxin [Ruminococcus sp. zg-924]MCQ4115162.1 flavodoxin [Ruminococcus sp. zg-921]